jgi:hypothetical protein
MERFSAHGRRAGALLAGLALAALPVLAFAQTDTGGDSAAAGLFVGGTLLFTCLCIAISFAIAAAIAYWVYNDAKKRGNPNAVVWAILTFISTLIGLVLYLVIGRNQGTVMGGPPPTGPSAPGGPGSTTQF